MHAAIAVSGPPQRDALDLAAQIHGGFWDLRSQQKTVVSGPAHSRCPAQPAHRCPRLGRWPDFLIEAALPLATTGRGCSLKRRKAFF